MPPRRPRIPQPPWRDFRFAYPGVSRRAGGVSLGINLNPDKRCNFDCVYCEVDRRSEPRAHRVDLPTLRAELRTLLDLWCTGRLFDHPPFVAVPPALRRLNGIAFSGDGEPTTCPQFVSAVETVLALRDELAPAGTKIVLITDSASLDRTNVRAGLVRLAQGAHEIWAKLDAGTEAQYHAVNRSRVPYERILQNIESTARSFPVFIQSMFLRLHGTAPSAAEIDAYCGRIETMLAHGANLRGLQLYTVARPTPEPWAIALSDDELRTIAARIEARLGLPQNVVFATTFHVPRPPSTP